MVLLINIMEISMKKIAIYKTNLALLKLSFIKKSRERLRDLIIKITFKTFNNLIYE